MEPLDSSNESPLADKKKDLQDKVDETIQGGLYLMQINYLHKNIYKLYKYSKPQEFLERHRQKYEDPVHKWECLKEQGVEEPVIASFAGIKGCIKETYPRHPSPYKEI